MKCVVGHSQHSQRTTACDENPILGCLTEEVALDKTLKLAGSDRGYVEECSECRQVLCPALHLVLGLNGTLKECKALFPFPLSLMNCRCLHTDPCGSGLRGCPKPQSDS